MTRRGLAMLWAIVLVGPVQADPMSDAVAAGQASISAIGSGMQQPNSGWATAAVQASPGGALPTADPQSAASDGAQLSAQCAGNASTDIACEAINAGATSATNNAYGSPSQYTQDVSTLGAGAVPTDSSIGGSYSACAQQSLSHSSTTTDLQYCYNYYLRSLNTPCDKTLHVQVTWHYACPDGYSGPFPTDPNWSNGDPVPQYCTKTDDVPYCDTGLSLDFTGAGYVCTASDGTTTPAQYREVVSTADADTWATTTDTWDNQCAGYEARVPPGLLPPDGVNDPTDYVFAAGNTGSIDKCERDSSQCTEVAETRIIDNYAVYRTCWQYSNAFSCVNLDPRSDCSQPRSPSCVEGATNCVDYDVFNNYCTATQTQFTCTTTNSSSQQIANCAGQTYTDNSGVTWNTGHPPDTDLASVVGYLEAGREAGGYMNNSLDVFKGYDSRCKKKLFGLVNCCNKGNSGSGSLFSDYSIAVSVLGQVGGAATSSYVMDSLYVSDAPEFVLDGLQSIFGGGSTSALAGLLAGDVSVESFLSTLVPGPWSIALLAIEYSGILNCDESSVTTALRRDANLCVDLGEYCSSRLPIIHTCVERTHTYCCYNSVLAKLINTQGKAQLGIGMGSSTAPNCDGFTPAQLQKLDLSSMDLSEFMAQVVPTTGQPAVTSCYFSGDTSCTPVH